MDMFITRILVAASDAMRHWTTPLTDPSAARAWMLLKDHPDVSPNVSKLIASATRETEDSRRKVLAQAFWSNYVGEFPVLPPAMSRLLACTRCSAAVRQHVGVNANQLVAMSDLLFPLQAIQQAKIAGTHTGYFDEIVCVWPWEGIDAQHLLDAAMPGSVVMLIEPGPTHTGWTGWAGFQSYQFIDNVQKSVEGRFKLVPLSNSKPSNVMVAVFGIEAL